MWASVARAGVYAVALVLLMWVLRKILTPITDMATSGPNASADSVQRVGSYFSALTLDNLVLLAAVAVGIFLIGRAAVERQVG